jgi:hypothetical protein
MSRHNQHLERHHILHEGAQWESQIEFKRLRRAFGMIALLHTDYHRPVLHAETPAIPLPPRIVAGRAHKLYEPSGDNVQAIDNMMGAIQDAAYETSRHDIELQQGLLCVQGLELVRPYIKEGLDFHRK